MLNDYTYMIEVERHRDAIDYAARQRLSRQAGSQRTTIYAWIRSALTRWSTSLHTKRHAVQAGEPQQNIQYHRQAV